jgi:hypothetical protein
MNNKRLLVYDIPHKAIRYALSQFSLLSGNTDYNNKEEIEKLKIVADDVFKMLDEHAEHENNVPLRYLEEKDPGSSAHDMEDHVEIETQMHKLREEFNKLYERSGKGEDLMYPGNDFFMNVSDFHSKYIEHMLEEERVTQPLLWKNFTDEELHQQEIEIKQSIKPESMLMWCKYMMPAFTSIARIGMLKEIKSMAPDEFFKAVMNVTKSVLPEGDFSVIEKSLN